MTVATGAVAGTVRPVNPGSPFDAVPIVVQIFPVHFGDEINAGDELAGLIRAAPEFGDGDVLVISTTPSARLRGRWSTWPTVAPRLAPSNFAGTHSDPRIVEVILGESIRVVRQRRPLLIIETHHGFVCASAGVDRSSAPRPDTVGIIADTMGRPLRDGVVGASGLVPPRELAGLVDRTNCELATTMVAIDEIASCKRSRGW